MTKSKQLQIYQDYTPKTENNTEDTNRPKVLGGEIWYN